MKLIQTILLIIVSIALIVVSAKHIRLAEEYAAHLRSDTECWKTKDQSYMDVIDGETGVVTRYPKYVISILNTKKTKHEIDELMFEGIIFQRNKVLEADSTLSYWKERQTQWD